MSVCPSARMQQLGSHWPDFHKIYFGIFRKSVEKIRVIISGTLHLWSYRALYTCVHIGHFTSVIIPGTLHLWSYRARYICDHIGHFTSVIISGTLHLWSYRALYICDHIGHFTFVIISGTLHLWSFRALYICDHIGHFTFVIISRSVIIMFQTDLLKKIKIQILCSILPPPQPSRKFFRLWDNVEKYCRDGEAADGNTAHAYSMLDT
jgi:hypothetical protein